MRQLTSLKAMLAGLALISLLGVAPALAQSNPVPQPGLEPIGGVSRSLFASLDPLPRYAVIPRVRLNVPSELPPVDVKPIDGGQAQGLGTSSASQVSGERPAIGVGSLGGPRNFGGASSAAAMPERHVNVQRVRAVLADLRTELGL